MANLQIDEFQKIKSLVYQNFGINLTDEKFSLVESRLNQTIISYGMSTFGEFYDFVVKDKSKEGQQLLSSSKEKNEHAYVVKEIRGDLRALCTKVSTPSEPELLPLHWGYHLRTPMKGKLKDGIGVQDILQRLHPTPAIAGWPTSRSFS